MADRTWPPRLTAHLIRHLRFTGFAPARLGSTLDHYFGRPPHAALDHYLHPAHLPGSLGFDLFWGLRCVKLSTAEDREARAERAVQAPRNEHHAVKKERRSVVDASLIHVAGHRPRVGGSCVEETSSGGRVTAPAVSAICPAGENIAIRKQCRPEWVTSGSRQRPCTRPGRTRRVVKLSGIGDQHVIVLKQSGSWVDDARYHAAADAPNS